jgi:hypothetical protein
MGKYLLLLIGVWFCNTKSVAQISWIKTPADMQFVCRNLQTQKGTLYFEGWVNQTGFNSLEITITASPGTSTVYSIPLFYTGPGQAYFNRKIYINTGKIKYSVSVDLVSGGNVVNVKKADNIICGDAYLINGQSNSVANAYVGLANTRYKDSFIRSFGSSNYSAVSAQSDTGWYIADGDGLYNKGCIGQWGLVLARKILDSAGIPVCIINAGVGGTPITFHQRNPSNAEDVYTNYGRMYYRAKKAGILDKVRGILWFQGESDGSNATLHDTLFRKMWYNWYSDFPSAERFVVVQIRSGCANVGLEIREKQRLYKDLKKTTVISANGLNSHDGCHYGFVNGYEKLGILMFNQLKTTLYKLPSTPENQPLHPYLAYFSNSSKSEICIEFSPLNATLKVDPNFHRLFSLNGSTSSITSGYLKNNKVYLTLSSGDCSVPSINYEGLIRVQPWVTTTADASLMTFWKFPVQKTRPYPNVSICKGQVAIMGTDSIPGCTYQWKGALSGKTFKTAVFQFKPDYSEKFILIIKTANSQCLYDTASQNVIVDSISSPNLRKQEFICLGDSVTLGNKKDDWVTGTWYQNSIPIPGFYLKTRDTGFYHFIARNRAGCEARDSVSIRLYQKPVSGLPDSIALCSKKTVLIHAPVKSSHWQWNNHAGADTFLLSSNLRKLALIYRDSHGCVQHDSTTIIELIPASTGFNASYWVCEKDSLLLTRPSVFQKWTVDGLPTRDSVFITLPKRYLLNGLDNQNCETKHEITLSHYPAVQFSLPDTAFCAGDSVLYTVSSGPFKTWHWFDGSQNNSCTHRTQGNYEFQWTDTHGCHGRSSYLVKTETKPNINFPIDTAFCRGDSIILSPSITNAPFMMVNNELISSYKPIKQPGFYIITAYKEKYCTSKAGIKISEIICQNSIESVLQESIKCRRIEMGLRLENVSHIFYNLALISVEGKMLNRQLLKPGETVKFTAPSAGFYILGIMQQGDSNFTLRKYFID